MILVWVSLAGGFGALTRALVDRLVAVRWPAWWATLGINLAGSFAVGVAAGVLSAAAFAVVGTGFCGGFTTFSTASWQVARELGIRDTLLTRWKRESQSQGAVAFGGTGAPRDEELARLKRELARVKKERDFLREAATFFAKGSS